MRTVRTSEKNHACAPNRCQHTPVAQVGSCATSQPNKGIWQYEVLVA
jgi:hypothetical protein